MSYDDRTAARWGRAATALLAALIVILFSGLIYWTFRER